jgi:hypothetical protein
MGIDSPAVVVLKRRNLRPWTPHDPAVFRDPHKQVTGNVAADARQHQEGACSPPKRSTVKAHDQQEQPDETQARSNYHNRAGTVAFLHLRE